MTTLNDPAATAANEENQPETPEVASGKKLVLGIVFGLIFGFLLQKGGVAKFHVLIGQLLLVDFTVLKIMMSAVVVGSIGIHFMHRAGLVELHVKPTRYASNIIGGLLFGFGFALAAYCPGTGAAALGQGNFDAIGMMTGMFAGSYLFAELSGWLSRRVDPIGERGKIRLPDLLPLSPTATVFATVLLICAVLAAVEVYAVR